MDDLQRYDRLTGDWSAESTGPFWGAVQLAHLLGRRGAGRSIAILDGWIDLTRYPRLAERVRSLTLCDGAAKTQIEHGTIVSLLASEVAPDAVIDFYGVCNPAGRPSPKAVAHALELLSEHPPDVVNMSIGRPRSWRDTLRLHSGPPDPFHLIPDPPIESLCTWCGPVDAAAAQLHVPVVAAVGNDPGKVVCPARSPYVFAVGFHVERRFIDQSHGQDYERATVDVPSAYGQGSEVAYTIEHVRGALGSSFSSPLLTGALALDVDPSLLDRWMDARAAGGRAHEKLYSGISDYVVDAKHDLASGFRAMPHDHFVEDEPQPCFECSLFCEGLYTSHVVYLIASGNPDALEVANRHAWMTQRLMPWSRHAFVNRAEISLRRAANVTSPRAREQLNALAVEDLERATICNPPSLLATHRLHALRGA